MKAFLIFVFCLVVSNNSCGKLLLLNIFKLILKVVPVLFLTASFSYLLVITYLLVIYLLYSSKDGKVNVKLGTHSVEKLNFGTANNLSVIKQASFTYASMQILLALTGSLELVI